MGEFGTVRRRGSERQLTFNSRALYPYAHEKAGQVLCNNVNSWFAVRVTVSDPRGSVGPASPKTPRVRARRIRGGRLPAPRGRAHRSDDREGEGPLLACRARGKDRRSDGTPGTAGRATYSSLRETRTRPDVDLPWTSGADRSRPADCVAAEACQAVPCRGAGGGRGRRARRPCGATRRPGRRRRSGRCGARGGGRRRRTRSGPWSRRWRRR